jgi:hypothetical protein
MEFDHVTNRYMYLYHDRYIEMIPYFLNGDITIVSESLQNLGLCSALRAFE